MLLEQAGVDGHVVDPLPGLLLAHVEEVLGLHVVDVAAEFLEHLIDRHGADRHGRSIDDRLPNRVDILPGGEVHHRVGAVMDGHVQLLQLRLLVAGHRRIADIGVDLGEGGDADCHRLEPLGEVHRVGGNHHPAPGDLAPDQLLGKILALGDELHLGRDLVGTGGFELGHAFISKRAAADLPGSRTRVAKFLPRGDDEGLPVPRSWARRPAEPGWRNAAGVQRAVATMPAPNVRRHGTGNPAPQSPRPACEPC